MSSFSTKQRYVSNYYSFWYANILRVSIAAKEPIRDTTGPRTPSDLAVILNYWGGGTANKHLKHAFPGTILKLDIEQSNFTAAAYTWGILFSRV